MPDFKTARTAYDDALEESWRLAGERERLEEENAKASREQQAAEAAEVYFQDKEATWNGILQNFENRIGTEINRFSELAGKRAEVSWEDYREDEKPFLPETAEELLAMKHSSDAEIAGRYRDAVGQADPLKEYEALKEGLYTIEREREREAGLSEKLAGETKLQEELRAEGTALEGRWQEQQARHHISVKLPETRKKKGQRRLHEKYSEEQIRTMTEALDERIAADTELKDAIGSFADFLKEEEDLQKEEHSIKKELKAQRAIKPAKHTPALIGTSLSQLEALSDTPEALEAPQMNGVSQSLKRYADAKKVLEVAEQQLFDRQIENTPIPDTFTALRKLDPRRYEARVRQINSLLSEKQGADKTPQNMQEYFDLESRSQELESRYQAARSQKGADQKAVQEFRALQNEKKEAAAAHKGAKKRVKDLIREYNRTHRAAEADLDRERAAENAEREARRDVEFTRRELFAAGAAYNDAAKKEAEQLNANEQAAAQKREDALKARSAAQRERADLHEAHRKQIGRLIDAFNQEHEPELKAAGDVHQKERSENEARMTASRERQAGLEAEREKDRDYQELVQKETEALNAQRGQVEDWIHRENDSRRRLNKEIRRQNEENRKGIVDYDKNADKNVQDYLQAEQKQARSDMRMSAARCYALGLAAHTMEKYTRVFRDVVVTMTEAAIRSPLYEKQEEIKELQKQLDQRDKGLSLLVTESGRAVSQAGGERAKVSLDDLNTAAKKDASDAKKAEDIYKQNRDLRGRLVEAGHRYAELQSSTEKRIQENREQIDTIFSGERTEKLPDGQDMSDRLTNIYENVARKQGEAADQILARSELDQKTAKEIREKSDREEKELRESLGQIETNSEKIKGLFTEDSKKKMDLAADALYKITKFISEKAADATGTAASDDGENGFDLRGKLDDLKKSMENPEEAKEHVADQLLDISRLAYQKIRDLNQEVKDSYLKAQEEATVCEVRSQGLEQMQEDFAKSQQENPGLYEGLPNLAEKWKAYLGAQKTAGKENIERNAKLTESAREEAGAQKKELTEQKQKKEAELAEKQEQITKNQQKLSEAREQARTSFLETVHENREEQPGQLSMDPEALAGMDGFAVLSALTGRKMSADMELRDAMNAMGSLYINGLNASAWFGLGERYQNLMQADPNANETPKERRNFVAGMEYFGNDIKQALLASADPEKAAGLTGYAKQLVGQTLSVEQDHMLLSAVTLKDNGSDKVRAYNRYAQIAADNFNQMRKEAASLHLAPKKENSAVREEAAGKKRVGLEELAPKPEVKKKSFLERAVHQSRDFFKRSRGRSM